MFGDQGSQLYASPRTLTGNVAKVKVMHELHHLASNGSNISILDIGCTGPRPLDIWEPLLADPRSRFHLTGVDKDVENARRIVAQRGWNDQVTLVQGNRYNLKDLFVFQSFKSSWLPRY
jgi:hypothetical protein